LCVLTLYVNVIQQSTDEGIFNEDFCDDSSRDSAFVDMIQTAPIHSGARPSSHTAQPRGFQVNICIPSLSTHLKAFTSFLKDCKEISLQIFI